MRPGLGLSRWLGWALAGWVAGTALQLQWAELPGIGWHLGVLGAAGLGFTWIFRKVFVDGWVDIAIIFVAFVALAWGTAGLRGLHVDAQALAPAAEGQDSVVTGVVAAMPQRSEVGQRFRFDIESAHLPLPPRIHLSWYAAAGGASQPRVQAGDRWQFSIRPKAPHGGLNPHGFDHELWMREQGLQASAYVRDGARSSPPVRIGRTWWHPVERARQQVRDAILDAGLPQRAAGVVAALVTGDQNAIERADWDIFRATGVAHLMSISGLHITMFAWAATALVGWGWRRSARLCLWHPAPHAALCGGLLLAMAYALFSGWGLPAQRTVLMLATAVLLRLSGRRWPWPLVWLLAGAVVVAVDPFALLQPGFWLSFVAVGVLFASGSTDPVASGLRAKTQQMLREQITITLALAPLSLLLFGQVSVVGLLANLLAIPWVTLVVTPLAMAGVVLAPLWQAAAAGVEWMGVALQALAALPGATWQVAQPPLGMAVVAVLGGLWLVAPLPWGHRLLALPLLLPVLMWQAPRPADGQFSLLAADVGQGNAVIVQTHAHALVYDAGPRYSQDSDAGHRVLVPLLRALNLRVDTLLLSHRDTDHTGGAAAVLAMQPQARLMGSLADHHELAQLRPLQPCVAGQRWRWDGVDFEILHPPASDPAGQRKSNAQSCVLRISNGQQTALLTGDIEREQEAGLVAADPPTPLRADVLLVPHHGSKTSSSEVFLDAVQPRIALIQNGYRNRFGHPAAEVLGRYEARQVRVFDSPHCGAAEWHSAAPDTVTCERERRKRYWHHRVP